MRGRQDRPVYIRRDREAGPKSGPATSAKKKKKKPTEKKPTEDTAGEE